MLNHTIHLTISKETKGALKYQEVDSKGNAVSSDLDGALVGIIYLRKAKLNGAKPQFLTITISDLDERELSDLAALEPSDII